MKTTVTILAAVMLLALGALSAQATTFWTETFSYGTGGLVALSGGNWTTHSGTGTDIRDTLNLAWGYHWNAPDDNRTFAVQDTFKTTCACFQVNIPLPATRPIVGNYFAHFKDTGTMNYPARVYALPVAGQNDNFTLGVSVSSANALAFLGIWPTALNYGTTYWVVVCYNAPAKTATLWVNPQSPVSASVTSSTSSTTPITKIPVSAYALRQSNAGSPTSGTVSWSYKVDNLGVGSTFYDACMFTGITPAASSTWGQLKKVYR